MGRIPSGLPTPGVPPVSGGDLRALIIPAARIAIVTFTDGVDTRLRHARRGQEVSNANAELRAVGRTASPPGDTRFPVVQQPYRLRRRRRWRTSCSLITLGLVVIVMVFT